MSKKHVGMIAVLASLIFAVAGKAGDVIVGKVEVTKTMGTMYEVWFPNKLGLKDTGGGFEQFVGVNSEVFQKGVTPVQAAISNLVQPTLTKLGSHNATVQVSMNGADVNWTAKSKITWYKNAQMEIGFATDERAFTIP